jgi:RNA polymerase sigma factor (sigma-70 family)
MKKPLSDRQIVDGLLLKQERLTNLILKQLYQTNKGPVKQFVFKCGGSLEDAEDVFQEVIVIFLENVWQKKFSLQEAEVSTYLYSIAKNVWYKKTRKNTTEDKYVTIYQQQKQDTDDQTPHEAFIEGEEQETLSKLFYSLPKPVQEVLESFYKEGLSMREIAEKLGLPSENSAKMRKSRGFQEWRELLTKYKFI